MFEHLGLQELWIDFGTGKAQIHIAVYTIVHNLRPEFVLSCHYFIPSQGVIPHFRSWGLVKKTAWATWNSFPDLTASLLKDPEKITLDSIHMQCLEKFTVMMYSKACNAAGVNEARQQLFSQGTRTLDMIPPTQQAMFQHILRALYQAAIIWMQSLQTAECTKCFTL